MPKSVFQNHYPVILEYVTTEKDIIKPTTRFDGLDDLLQLTATTLTKQERILELLSLIGNHLFFQYNAGDDNWGMPVLNDDPGEEANSWSSKWCWKMFHWPELPDQLKISHFSDVSLPPIEQVAHKVYYQYEPNFDNYTKRPVTLPNTVFDILNSYYSLNGEKRTYVDTAMNHLYTSMELHSKRKTTAMISAFTAIETMMNYEYRDVKPEHCDSCGQLKYKVSERFRNFLLKYIGTSDANKKTFNQLYSLRSKVIHTGEQLETERRWTDIPQDKKDEEFITLLKVLVLGKLAVINWILVNGK
jgi:hypothetical protein